MPNFASTRASNNLREGQKRAIQNMSQLSQTNEHESTANPSIVADLSGVEAAARPQT